MSSVKIVFPKIKKDTLNNDSRNDYMLHEILVMKIMLFLSFFYAKFGKLREIHGNRSLWLEVADKANGLHPLGLYFIVAFYTSELRSDFYFFFTQRYSKYFENASKIYFLIKSQE